MLNNKHQTIRQGKTSRNLIKSQQLFFIVKIKQMTSLFLECCTQLVKNILATKGR